MKLLQRELGRCAGSAPGPTVIAVAGIHGNEPAGVHAALRLFPKLDGVRGEVVVLAGNLGGLRDGVRYRAKDLNRVWSEAHLAALRSGAAQDEEDREQLELFAAIEAARARARGAVYLIDLHTTSAAGIPFMLFGDTRAQRRFVSGFPIPAILGLEEQLDGVLSSYWARRGLITAAVEGGQHDDPATIDSLEAVLWVAIAQAGAVARARDEVRAAALLLDQKRSGLPRLLEVLSRRAITGDEQFRMEPGFRNIDYARRGQLLARDRDGEIRAPHDGLVIMPLYQGLGGDGFFWGRQVGPLRRLAAAILQPLRLARLLALLPGIATRGAGRYAVADRWVSLFRLLGYRRLRRTGEELTVEREAG